MHGYAVEDEKGNIVRVLEVVNGKTIHDYMQNLNLAEREYI
jgi:hypothetical protein